MLYVSMVVDIRSNCSTAAMMLFKSFAQTKNYFIIIIFIFIIIIIIIVLLLYYCCILMYNNCMLFVTE